LLDFFAYNLYPVLFGHCALGFDWKLGIGNWKFHARLGGRGVIHTRFKISAKNSGIILVYALINGAKGRLLCLKNRAKVMFLVFLMSRHLRFRMHHIYFGVSASEIH